MGLLSRFFKINDNEDQGQTPPKVLPMRNDLCWCDSGLKYKKCHLEQDQLYLERQRRKEQAMAKACSPAWG